MKLLDKYILKQFLSTFFFVVLILLAVISVIDMTDKMDKFAKAQLTSGQIFGYYLDFIPWIGSLVTPITIFIATVYVCSRMAGRTEVIAILSAGISFRRMMLPYFMGSFVIAILSFVLNGWIIPNSNKSKLAFEVQYLKNKYYYDKQNIHIQVGPDVYLYMKSYNNTNNTGYQFTLERFEDNKMIEKLTANRVEWDTTKKKWTLRDWRLHKIQSIFEKTSGPESTPGLETSKRVTVADSTKSGATMDTALVIHPKEFESDYRKYDGMTLNELNKYIKTLRSRGSTGIEVYEVERYTRYTSPFTIFILVFMGVIVSSRKSRGGTGLQIALGFLLSFIFILFFTLFRTFAENGSLPPQISVWIPNIIFGIISLVMYKYVPR
ncbi:LptF/LptG family permease [Ohtaekwangia koreensis]|uniref:Lipopolysaccharide export system permease protein n=1 Tax=Ohtaekwangia koreensis TaxID=688867 RepID=A0A1T5IMY4_9BACT|nr:LptF/LptG family permease [Ohtaekwangia koreensis]SKC40517.1 lipopolysaccharide export system permease protein [Ohtaekwangia koreensis]